MNDDSCDSAAMLETHVGPSLACVDGLIDTVSHYVDVANRPSLSCAGPDATGIGGRHCNRADGGCRLFIEDRFPYVSAIGGRSEERRVGKECRSRGGA